MKIGVIGLGLIGGSIFKALSSNHKVVAVSRSINGENISNDYNTLKDCDVVFVCTPMNATLEVLDKLNEILAPSTIVTDVCSLKEFVSNKKYNYKFIPSHPMAGTENSGCEFSFEEMFNGAKWVITPIDGEVLQEQDVLESLILEMKAEPIITSAKDHDKAVALISHAPLVIAQALCQNIKDNKLAQALASSGFRDTTRLALSNTEMANDMVQMNRENIDFALKTFIDSIDKILQKDYLNNANEIKDFRQNLYTK